MSNTTEIYIASVHLAIQSLRTAVSLIKAEPDEYSIAKRTELVRLISDALELIDTFIKGEE
jgi:hypothetical protein